MSLKEQIQKDRITALKNRDSVRKNALDYILGQVQTKEKDPNQSGDITTAVIVAYLKSLKDFIEQHGEARKEQAEAYRAEIVILEEYLPKQLSPEEIKSEVQNIQASGVTAKGLIMKNLKEKFGTGLDGRLAAKILDELGVK